MAMVKSWLKTMGFKASYAFFVYKFGMFEFCILNLHVDASDVGGPLFIPAVEWFTLGVREAYGRAVQPIPRYY